MDAIYIYIYICILNGCRIWTLCDLVHVIVLHNKTKILKYAKITYETQPTLNR